MARLDDDAVGESHRIASRYERSGEAGIWLGGFVLFLVGLIGAVALWHWIPLPNTWRL